MRSGDLPLDPSFDFGDTVVDLDIDEVELEETRERLALPTAPPRPTFASSPPRPALASAPPRPALASVPPRPALASSPPPLPPPPMLPVYTYPAYHVGSPEPSSPTLRALEMDAPPSARSFPSLMPVAMDADDDLERVSFRAGNKHKLAVGASAAAFLVALFAVVITSSGTAEPSKGAAMHAAAAVQAPLPETKLAAVATVTPIAPQQTAPTPVATTTVTTSPVTHVAPTAPAATHERTSKPAADDESSLAERALKEAKRETEGAL